LRCFLLRRPLPRIPRHVLEAFGEVPRGRRHLVEDLWGLSVDPLPRGLHQLLKSLLVFLKARRLLVALLGHSCFLL